MNAQELEQDARSKPSRRTAFRLLRRVAAEPPMEVTPPPRPEEEHPPDEPGYGHGV